VEHSLVFITVTPFRGSMLPLSRWLEVYRELFADVVVQVLLYVD